MSFDPKVIEALALLRDYAKHSMVAGPVCEAIETLDNAGVFAALDEQADYASAEEILAESALMSMEQKSGRWAVADPDPDEWSARARAIEDLRPKGRRSHAESCVFGDECPYPHAH
jgi:hypothetical protein